MAIQPFLTARGRLDGQKLRWNRLAHRNYLLNLEEIRHLEDHLASAPIQIMVDLIGVCNMRPHCCMCVLDEATPSVHPGLEHDAFDHCDELIERCSYITDCSTGEVLLHPHLFTFLNLVRSKGKAIGLTSNAISLSKKMTDRLLPYSHSLYLLFSLDAASSTIYRRVRGPHFHQVCSNIANYCRERRRQCGLVATDVGLCFIPMRCNRHEIPEFFDLAKDLGVDYVLFTSLYSRPVNRVVHRGDFVFDYYRECLGFRELEECRGVALENSHRTGIPFRCQYNLTDEQIAEEFKPPEVSDVDARCVMPWRYAKLVHNGETHPCLYIQESMGDWKSGSFESIWNCGKWREIRAELASGRLAERCFNASSCPIVRCHRSRHPRSDAADGLLSRARIGEVYLIDVSDRDFEPLIVTGVHPIEPADHDGHAFRWLNATASFRLPNPRFGRTYDVGIHVQCLKPDIRDEPIHTAVRIDGEIAGRSTVVNDKPTALIFSLKSSSARPLVEISSTPSWRPSDYSADGSGDRRLLSFRVTNITIVPRRTRLSAG